MVVNVVAAYVVGSVLLINLFLFIYVNGDLHLMTVQNHNLFLSSDRKVTYVWRLRVTYGNTKWYVNKSDNNQKKNKIFNSNKHIYIINNNITINN